MNKYILSIDQGTTSTRAILFDQSGQAKAMYQQEFTQIFPKPGWVEHDPIEIWSSVVNVVSGVLINAKVNFRQISALGITNQRETTVIWNKETGEPIYNAIVWQSRQSEEISERLIEAGHRDWFHQRTGLIINPYFSATKICWILENIAGARTLAKEGKLLFGTMDTWIIWKMTNGKVHATDYSNASRTMLFNINTLQWDEEILTLLEIPKSMLPEVRNSSEIYGYAEELSPFGGTSNIPIAGVAGDQQAALFGQCCFKKGQAKNTYGTGCFLLLHTGDKPVYSANGLLTTIAWGFDGKVEYALEGSVFVAGSVIQWIRDGLSLIRNSSDSEECSRAVPSTEGVYFVPAFVGLGTPYWDNEARGAIFGLTRGTTKQHFVRAALESIAYQTVDVMQIMNQEANSQLTSLAADGGATENKILMQFQADMLQCDIVLPAISETTALGVAYLAGLAVGYYSSKDAIQSLHQVKATYHPQMERKQVDRLYDGWKRAVSATRNFKVKRGEEA